MPDQSSRISVVTPTLRRPQEVQEMLINLAQQTHLPHEVILVDGAPQHETDTEKRVVETEASLPFRCIYIRHGGGTAIQRNVGIDTVTGNYIAFIDDDIRLEPEFFAEIMEVYAKDTEFRVGGIAGYIANQHLDPTTSTRWRWYKKLKLFTTYEPGRYDYQTGYPINRYLQPPHEGIREIDFMGSGCAVWRSEVFQNGFRFDEFFRDYGMLEDAHLALRAKQHWKLLECGQARCQHLHSPSGRVSRRKVARKTAINYRYVFVDIVRNRSWKNEFRFWRVQLFDLFRLTVYAIQHHKGDDWLQVLGKAEGIVAAISIRPRTASNPQ